MEVYPYWTDTLCPVPLPLICSAEVRGKCPYENWNTTTIGCAHIPKTPPQRYTNGRINYTELQIRNIGELGNTH